MTTILTGVVVLGIVYMLVRPGSPSATAVKLTTNIVSNLIKAAISGGNA